MHHGACVLRGAERANNAEEVDIPISDRIARRQSRTLGFAR
jgi:hypothetical protein